MKDRTMKIIKTQIWTFLEIVDIDTLENIKRVCEQRIQELSE